MSFIHALVAPLADALRFFLLGKSECTTLHAQAAELRSFDNDGQTLLDAPPPPMCYILH